MIRRIARWFGRLIHPTKEKEKQHSNNPKISRTMARKTVISKVVDEEPRDGVMVLPQNRTLYADQFTDEAPVGEPTTFQAKSMKDVFEHYQPKVEDIELNTEDGNSTFENFEFRQIKDFEDDQLIAQSKLMSEEKSKVGGYNSIIRQLEKNKTLRNVMKDDASRNGLKDALKALLAEIEDEE